jgi:hypothetical protein
MVVAIKIAIYPEHKGSIFPQNIGKFLWLQNVTSQNKWTFIIFPIPSIW